MDAITALRTRRSKRMFTPHEIGDRELQMLAELASCAPNSGPCHVSITKREDIIKLLEERLRTAMQSHENPAMQKRAAMQGYKPLYGATAIAVISAPADGKLSQYDVTCAAMNIITGATSMSLGSCFELLSSKLVLERDRQICDILGMPREYVPYCSVLLGYGSEAEEHEKRTNNISSGII